ncbi:MAG: hypothetical protein ABFD77_09555 [Thermotogota bacterium]
MSVSLLLETLSGYRARRSSGGEVQLECPECARQTGRPDRKRHLYINAERGQAHCFRCGYSSRDIGKAARFIFGPEIGAEVARAVGCRVASTAEEMLGGATARKAEGAPADPWDVIRWPGATVSILGDDEAGFVDARAQALRLLLDKGLSREEVARYEFRAVLGASRPTVVIPVHDERGALVYYYFRDSTGRYTYPSEEQPTKVGGVEFPRLPGKGTGHFPIGLAWNRWRRREVYVVEGAFDAFGINRFFRWGVALGGKAATDDKAKRIAALPVERIIVTLDGKADVSDADIFKVADRIASHAGPERVFVLRLREGDPGDWLKAGRPSMDPDDVQHYMAFAARRRL